MILEYTIGGSILILIWMYILYPVTLIVISLFSKKEDTTDEFTPKISLLLCTFNESFFIEKRIQNILDIDYPENKVEILVVDSSSDDTPSIIEQKFGEKVRLIKQEKRMGKANALNLGLSKSINEIVVLTDATVLFKRDAVKNVIRYFQDPSVGVVTGKYIPIGGETTFWSFKNWLKRLESSVDSTSFVSGDLAALSKKAITHVNEDTLCDDVNIALQARKNGFRVLYDNEAHVTEQVTDTIDDFFTQKKRRAIGGIQESLRFRGLAFNPKYGFFGLFIMPSRILFTIFNPILISIIIGYIISNIISHNILTLILIPTYLVGNHFLKNTFIFNTINTLILTILVQISSLYSYIIGDYNVNWKKISIFQPDKKSK